MREVRLCIFVCDIMHTGPYESPRTVTGMRFLFPPLFLGFPVGRSSNRRTAKTIHDSFVRAYVMKQNTVHRRPAYSSAPRNNAACFGTSTKTSGTKGKPRGRRSCRERMNCATRFTSEKITRGKISLGDFNADGNYHRADTQGRAQDSKTEISFSAVGACFFHR